MRPNSDKMIYTALICFLLLFILAILLSVTA